MKEIKLTKSGEYMCSACKAAPKEGPWPRRWKWKTEKGFLNHFCIVEAQERRRIMEEECKIKEKKDLAKWIAMAKYKIGETVFYYAYTITKPTHEQRGSRLVKVRYEELRSYYSRQGTIQSICIGGYLIDNQIISECDISKSNDEIEKMAKAAMLGYKQQCDFASMVR